MSRSVALVIALMVIWTATSQVDAIRCYTCHVGQKGCGDPFDKNESHRFLQTCKYDVNNCIRSTTTTIFGIQAVFRGCGPPGVRKTMNLCTSVSSGKTGTELCTCSSHGCNGGVTLQSTGALFAGTMLLLAVLLC